MHELAMPWWSLLPFAILLGCIAVFPLVPALAHRWERRSFQLAVALALGVPMAAYVWSFGAAGQTRVVHALVEYAQFIALLLSLFVVSGGIFLAGDIQASPRNNTLFLAVGGLVASFIGTTGAAMLLIRPLLNTNKERRLKQHTVVFAIFIVANCGGLLTPLGDPPLFLGMLRGVPFLWTLQLFPEWLFVNGLLLLTYWALDRRAYSLESAEAVRFDDTNVEPLAVLGKVNFVFLALIVAAVALLPSVDLDAIHEGRATPRSWVPLREIVMLGCAALSYRFSDRVARFELNRFTWGPIAEVAALFVGIFLTMVPALVFLGEMAPSLPLNEITFFLFSGGLSSVLDNAPTYATFFEMARSLGAGGPDTVAATGVAALHLEAISLGAVFCGANTYIGNGPNFMVKAVAESGGVPMPTFGGYVVWAAKHLVPVLLAMLLIFIAQPVWAKVAGLVLAGGIVARSLRLARRSKEPAHARIGAA